MSRARRIPSHHQIVIAAAVRAVLGENAVVHRIVEVPPPSLRVRVTALHCGIQTFWNRWTGRTHEEVALR